MTNRVFISRERSDEAIPLERGEYASLGGDECTSLGGHGALRALAMTIV